MREHNVQAVLTKILDAKQRLKKGKMYAELVNKNDLNKILRLIGKDGSTAVI